MMNDLVIIITFHNFNGVYGYPTNFLLNPEGVIIAKNLRGKALEEKVLGLIEE